MKAIFGILKFLITYLIICTVIIMGYMIVWIANGEIASAKATQLAPTRPVRSISLAFQPDSFDRSDLQTGKLLVTVQTVYDVDIKLNIDNRNVISLSDATPDGINLMNPMSLIGMDSPIVPIPAAINQQSLPGEYLIIVQAVRSDNPEDILAENSVKIFVTRHNNHSYFLTSPDDFELYLRQLSSGWYSLPNNGYKVAVVLDEGEYPQNGELIVHVQGIKAISMPTIMARVGLNSGIKFSQNNGVQLNENNTSATMRLETMIEGESRILSFPFVLNPDSFEGQYAIELVVQSTDDTFTDRVPIAIRLENSTLNEPAKWLVLSPLN